MSIDDFKLIVNIERLYLKGVCRKDIAKKYGISIIKVNRCLDIASTYRA